MSALTGKGELWLPGSSETVVMARNAAKYIFVLLCYSIDRNVFRLRKGIAVRLENSPLFEKGLLHELVR